MCCILYPHLLHSDHCHRQTVQKETCNWDRRPGREPALRYSVQSAARCRSLKSEEKKGRIIKMCVGFFCVWKK